MKKFLLAVLALASTITLQASAQQKTSVSDSVSLKRAQNVYFELLGNGGAYSFNYDSRFGRRQDGLGGRIGLSYFAGGGDNFFSAPLVLNYLAGKKGRYFETGAGITVYSANISPIFEDTDEDTTTNIFGTLTFGYRSQPLDGGFMFRAGVSPIITRDAFVPYWPYVSFGYSF